MTTQNLKKKKNNNLKDQKRTKPSQASPITIRLSSNQGVKRAVEELRESEKKYKELADFLPEMVYEADKNGEIVFTNRCAFEIFGYAQEDFDKGVSLFEMVIPEDRGKVLENLRRLLMGEKVTDNQYTALRKDGSTFPIIATANLIIRENKSVGVRGVIVDITERKLAEEALRRSEEEAKQLAKENAAMAEIGRIISSTLNIDEVYERFAEEVKKLTPFDRIVISTINIEEATAKNVYMAGKGIGDRKVEETYPLEGSGNAEMARTKSTLLVQTQDFNEFKDRFPMLLSTFQVGFRSIMDVPLLLKGQIIGGLLLRSLKPYAYTDRDVALAEKIGNQIAGAIVNAQLFAQHEQAEEALRSERDKFRGMLLAIHDGVDIVNNDYVIEFQNKILQELFGNKIGEKCYAAYMGLEEPCHFCSIQEAIKTGSAIRVELVGKNGRNYELNSSPFTDVDGNVKVIELVRDITERKRAEEVLRQSEEKYRTILENIADGYYEVDLAGNLTFFNDSVIQLLGYSKEELIGKNNREYMNQENTEKLYQAFNKVYRTGEPTKVFGWEIIRKDGTKRFIEASVSLVKNPLGQPTGFRGIVRDITERKRAEENLRESEEKYRLLVEGLAQGIVIGQGIPPRVTFANPAMTKILGYNLEEFSSLSPKEIEGLVHPEDRAVFFKNYKDRLEGKSVVPRYEIRGIRKDGTLVWLELSSTRIEFKGQSAVQAAFLDISERKRAEESLRESEERYRTILENIEDGYYEVDLPGNFTFFNDSLCRMLGYSRDEMIGMANQQYTDEKNRKKLIHAFNEFYRTGKPIKGFGWEVFRKDGTKLFSEVSVSLIKDSTGQPTGFRGIARDITERKWVEDALQKSEMRFQELFNDAPVGYFEYNVEGRLTNVNRTELEMLGYKIEEMIGQPVWKFVVEREVAHHQILEKLSGALPPARGLERTYQRKDGTTLPVLIEDRTLRDSQGKIIGIRSTIHDITDRKRAEQEMNTLAEQLRQSQKMEAIGRLAGGIAHDFNNLLTIIKGYSQLSLLDLKESDTLWGNIQEIQKATQRATDLTRQLLAFSRRQILDLKVLNLNTLLRDLDKMLRRIIGEDIELFTLLAEDLGRVRIDPGQFEQMILNLAVNSRDAMLSGGKLAIETANVELDEDYAHAHIGVTPGRYVRLSFSDTGAGMLPEVREKVFEPFFTTKEKGKGTGLGLSMVYGIVKQSGGNIWVYSESGQGTTFKIYLPIVEQDLDALEKKEETEAFPRGTETVLLVEDEPLVRDLALRLLSQQGYTILEAANGEEALHVVNEQSGKTIQLLLTDVVMPQMGGKELADKLKSLRPDIKVLYTSGYTDNAIVHHGVLEPGTHFLQKPFSPKSLFSKVREVLDR